MNEGTQTELPFTQISRFPDYRLSRQLKKVSNKAHSISKSSKPSYAQLPDQFTSQKRYAIAQHSLWKHSIFLLWRALVKQSNSLSYTKYKQFRGAYNKALSIQLLYKDFLSRIWREWPSEDKSTYEKLTSLKELALSNSKIDFDKFNLLILELLNLESIQCEVSSYLIFINLLFLQITEGDIAYDSGLKEIDNIQNIKNTVLTQIKAKSGNRTEFKNGYNSNFVPTEDIKCHVCHTLAEIFPGDLRVHSLWDFSYKEETPVGNYFLRFGKSYKKRSRVLRSYFDNSFRSSRNNSLVSASKSSLFIDEFRRKRQTNSRTEQKIKYKEINVNQVQCLEKLVNAIKLKRLNSNMKGKN